MHPPQVLPPLPHLPPPPGQGRNPTEETEEGRLENSKNGTGAVTTDYSSKSIRILILQQIYSPHCTTAVA